MTRETENYYLDLILFLRNQNDELARGIDFLARQLGAAQANEKPPRTELLGGQESHHPAAAAVSISEAHSPKP